MVTNSHHQPPAYGPIHRLRRAFQFVAQAVRQGCGSLRHPPAVTRAKLVERRSDVIDLKQHVRAGWAWARRGIARLLVGGQKPIPNRSNRGPACPLPNPQRTPCSCPCSVPVEQITLASVVRTAPAVRVGSGTMVAAQAGEAGAAMSASAAAANRALFMARLHGQSAPRHCRRRPVVARWPISGRSCLPG